MQCIPGGHYLALKPQHTSVQRIDGFFFGKVSLSISPPFWIVDSVIMNCLSSWRLREYAWTRLLTDYQKAWFYFTTKVIQASIADGQAITQNNCTFWRIQNPGSIFTANKLGVKCIWQSRVKLSLQCIGVFEAREELQKEVKCGHRPYPTCNVFVSHSLPTKWHTEQCAPVFSPEACTRYEI